MANRSINGKKTVIDSGLLDLPKHRLDNIYRTNLQGNYMSGKWEQFVRNADRRPYLMYDAINDSRVRPAHLALDRIIRRIDDPFWKTHSAPNGFRCRCSLIALTEKEAQSRSRGGNGLNKQPIVDLGNERMTQANPDPGWEYNPSDRMQGVESAIAKKSGKVDNKLMDAIKSKLDDQKSIESAMKASINYVLENGRPLESQKIEFCSIFNKTGSVFLQKKGVKSEVSFTEDEVGTIKSCNGAYLVHNHPSSSSLSEEDFIFSHTARLSVIVAAGHNGIIYSGKIIDKKAFDKFYLLIENDVKRYFYSLIRSDDISIHTAETLHYHTINTIMDYSGIVEYSALNAEPLIFPGKIASWVNDIAHDYINQISRLKR